MGDVYAKATAVLTWLGTGDEETTAALLTLDEIASSSEKYGIREICDGVVQFQGYAQISPSEENALEYLAATIDLRDSEPFIKNLSFLGFRLFER